MRLVIEYSKWWEAKKTKELKVKNVAFTYDLRGTNESMSSNHGVMSSALRNPQSVGSRKRKEPTENSLRAKGKKVIGEIDVSRQ